MSGKQTQNHTVGTVKQHTDTRTDTHALYCSCFHCDKATYTSPRHSDSNSNSNSGSNTAHNDDYTPASSTTVKVHKKRKPPERYLVLHTTIYTHATLMDARIDDAAAGGG